MVYLPRLCALAIGLSAVGVQANVNASNDTDTTTTDNPPSGNNTGDIDSTTTSTTSTTTTTSSTNASNSSSTSASNSSSTSTSAAGNSSSTTAAPANATTAVATKATMTSVCDAACKNATCADTNAASQAAVNNAGLLGVRLAAVEVVTSNDTNAFVGDSQAFNDYSICKKETYAPPGGSDNLYAVADCVVSTAHTQACSGSRRRLTTSTTQTRKVNVQLVMPTSVYTAQQATLTAAIKNTTKWQEKIVAKAAIVKNLTPAALAALAGVSQQKIFGKAETETITAAETAAYTTSKALIPTNVTITEVSEPVTVDPTTGQTTTAAATTAAATSSATSVQGSVVVAALLSAFALA